MTDTEKLQKVLARAGVGSRRAMEQWIEQGRIRVNGRLAKLGDRVSRSDSILVDGQPMPSADRLVTKCLIYHKPEGEICSRADQQDRPTVFANLPPLTQGRWVAVGRLDLNTSGLLLFTNDGDLANRLMHPSTGVVRRYMARVRGRPSEQTIAKITRQGVMLDGKSASFDEVKLSEHAETGSNCWIEVTIREGRYREVRRILEAVGHPVSRLKRIAYGTVKLPHSLRQGRFEKMAPLQLEKLMAAYGLEDLLVLPGGAARSAKTNAIRRASRRSKPGGQAAKQAPRRRNKRR